MGAIRNAGLDQPVEGRDAISVAPVAITKMMVTDEISLLRVYELTVPHDSAAIRAIINIRFIILFLIWL
ncbi:MAG: hypothetical protein H0V76_00925 [Blastocatellia bacterium]|nr:hypothetical protein [Blastocatellia bacterium]